ncbi:MAG: PH domain-containing protein [Flavobacteriales bacterium]|nr:PH domain-containing protein [Flavobacteriales bacterium]
MEFTNEPVTPQELPLIEEVEFESHPKRYLKYRAVGFTILLLVLSGSWIGQLIGGIYIGVIIAASIWLVLLVLIFGLERKRFAKMGYVLRSKDVTYKRGLIFHKIVTLPFNRIQHTEISQGPIEKKFNLSTLKIFTAGGSGSDLSISGLDPETAQKMKEYISSNVSDSE